MEPRPTTDDEASLQPAVYSELRRLASRAMRGERADHTLQPTALAHEAYMRLALHPESPLRDKNRFAPLAARAMRRILVDHARARSAEKRGSGRVKPLEGEPEEPERDRYLVALDEALGRLAETDARLAQIVELKFFGGCSVEETAEVLGVSTRTVKRGWSVAKGWLHRAVADEDAVDD